jgi:hypothetical protein
LTPRPRSTGIPAAAWDYKLGNRSGLEWVLDQWKEHKISDPTVAAKFNTYRFADHKEQVIELLQRVCTVSVETMKIVRHDRACRRRKRSEDHHGSGARRRAGRRQSLRGRNRNQGH